MGKYAEGKDYKVIAFVIALYTNDENLRLIRKMAAECEKYNCKVVFFTTLTDFFYEGNKESRERMIFDAICVEKYDAVVLMGETFKMPELYEDMLKRAKKAQVPVISVDTFIEGCVNIQFEYEDSFRQIVEHMVEFHGFRKINFMAGMPDNAFSEERVQIYKDVLEKNGIPFEEDRLYYGYFWDEPTLKALDEMAKKNLEDTQAIICANDMMAITVGKYLVQQGYRVPEDIAISGYDGIQMERFCNPRLTTGISNLENLVETILTMVSEDTISAHMDEPIYVHNKMQIGRSCGCEGKKFHYASYGVMEVKNESDREIRFYGDMAGVLTNCSIKPDPRRAIHAYKYSLNLLGYRNFWYCSNDEISEYVIKEAPKTKETFRENMHAIRYKREEKGVAFNIPFRFEELIPDRDVIFENSNHLLVLLVYLEGDVSGYTVIDFDDNAFWYPAYPALFTSFRSMLEVQKIYQRMIHFYQDDSLTGLLNRIGFYEVIPQMMEEAKDKEMSLISIDMDRLKMINDTFGHTEGDIALAAIGKIIRGSVKNEIAARIGGDEFLIALFGDDIEERTEEIVENIKKGLLKYNQKSKKSYVLEASIGAYTNQIKNRTLDHFLKQADDLMYARKYLRRRERGEL